MALMKRVRPICHQGEEHDERPGVDEFFGACRLRLGATAAGVFFRPALHLLRLSAKEDVPVGNGHAVVIVIVIAPIIIHHGVVVLLLPAPPVGPRAFFVVIISVIVVVAIVVLLLLVLPLLILVLNIFSVGGVVVGFIRVPVRDRDRHRENRGTDPCDEHYHVSIAKIDRFNAVEKGVEKGHFHQWAPVDGWLLLVLVLCE
mmetsp:Transcript_51041/g.153431  ORF Transcript_51041/g.153431 Transcript_51041/m.153431 type:complete len:201 (+) Transcript_51041:876-1478(+)